MSNFQAFEAAAEMLQPTYTHATLHVIAELRGTQWCNLYTSFIYGREIDLLSVPAYYEHAIYNSSVLCVRARITRPDADTKRRARLSARQQTEAATKVAAQNIATKLNVSISFYRIESLHDRFLLIGDRLWHVGCSFNAFGQEISAVVEMRDERAKASMLDIFERTTARLPVFTVTP